MPTTVINIAHPPRRFFIFFALFLLFVQPLCALAQETDSAMTSSADSCEAHNVGAARRMADGVVNLAETVLDALTIERDKFSLALYPAGSYSGRYGLALGIMPLLQIRHDGWPRAATITPAILVSTKRMFEVQCDADIYLLRRIDISAKFEAYRQPDDLYPVGNGRDKSPLAHYDFSRRFFTADVLKGCGESGPWRAGVRLEFDKYNFSDIEPSSQADSAAAFSLALSAEKASYGAGLIGGYDGRDNVLSPSSGLYALASVTGFVSDDRQGFGLMTIDVRHYWPLPMESILAAQLYASAAWGDAPFTKMPTCGGTRLGRAIGHNLKYVDSEAWLAQAEWRVPLFWRIGAVAFGAVGNVAGGAADIFDDVHVMCGAGLRLAVFPGKGLNLRLDGGVSNHGDRAIYFNVREAF